ncbi:hypothetical protein AMK59_3739 [Oryctes borbonicus]|uniref:FAD synthase n=1 Tax=Oryctes borbonicus TaxID=1629725 RepID=A0A0T6B8S1_9SCAR|nr:hypothetical protein AMK59_3739 [Oryctes borbonicus]
MLQYIEKCFSDYGLENVFVSFNGGKDCTVLLHLVLGILKSKYPNYKDPIVCMYVQSSNPFPEVDHFIEMVRDFYNLDIVTIPKGVREGLESFLESRSNMKACLMGTRRTDPYSESLQIFQMTDSHWPQVMRVSPLLDWHYSEIWDYLLYYQVPYCSLYDEGYTSLGGVNNTIRNPNLLYNMDDDSEIYLPAYKLLDGNTERNGRT